MLRSLGHAKAAAARGYHVFPAGHDSKRPILPAGHRCQRLPGVPGWATHVVTHDDGWESLAYGDGRPAAGSYLSSVDPWLIERLWWDAYVLQRYRPPRVGITSPATLIDIDGEAPAAVKKLLRGLPSMPSPHGVHYLARAADLTVGGLYTEGVHWGDVKHLTRSYSICYDVNRLPKLDWLPELPDGLLELLQEYHGGAPGMPGRHTTPGSRRLHLGRLMASLKLPDRVTPDVLRECEGGRHDAMLRGVSQDVREGVKRLDEWTDALYVSALGVRGHERTRHNAAREVRDAHAGAVRLAEPDPEPEPAPEYTEDEMRELEQLRREKSTREEAQREAASMAKKPVEPPTRKGMRLGARRAGWRICWNTNAERVELAKGEGMPKPADGGLLALFFVELSESQNMETERGNLLPWRIKQHREAMQTLTALAMEMPYDGELTEACSTMLDWLLARVADARRAVNKPHLRPRKAWTRSDIIRGAGVGHKPEGKGRYEGRLYEDADRAARLAGLSWKRVGGDNDRRGRWMFSE